MAGGDEAAFAHYTGFKKYFNSETQRGRLNWVFATYGSLFLAIVYFRSRSKKKAKLQTAAALPPPSK